MLVKFTLNGDPVEVALKSDDRLLVDVLREDLALTGTKHGCGIGACGTCTVIMDGEPIASCLQLAGTHALHAVQQAFVNKAAFQCGICTPGHIMAACSLLDKHPRPSDEEILASADSVYCRCTGYVRIVEAYSEAVRIASRPAE
jgi:aerobic-type carbon monoxide dehydrogenase small subunit (CoxS/CutS family)